MPLVKSYRRASEDDEDSANEAPNVSTSSVTPKSIETLPETTKKRPAPFAAEAAAKLLKLTENVGSDKMHSIDVASQLLDSKNEKKLQPKSSSNSDGPRSLLDMLPTPKSASSHQKAAEDPQSSSFADQNDSEMVQSTSTAAPTHPTSPAPIPALVVPKSLKMKSLSPDVKLDESFVLKELEQEEKLAQSLKTDASKPVAPPARVVGPSRPSYLSSVSQQDDDEDMPSLSAYESTTSYQAPSAPLHYDPVFGIVEGSAQVVELDMNTVMQQSGNSGSFLPSRPNLAAASRNANISRAARGKNQITYLAAIANETERFNQEKRAEQVRNKNRSGI